MKKYTEYKHLDLPTIGADVLRSWEEQHIFDKSLSTRKDNAPFVFYEGPPSANGMPGIHHVMARAIKDIFCRYQTLQGKLVKRKAGWDTHGLPIELAVEKTLGITKEDIGKKISIEDYNKACRKEVLKYQDRWEELTRLMGYWVDMKHPYVTFDNTYMESVWWLLKQLYSKDLLYKGYTIQPYSPAAGTGLSSHEINQPGCYRNVKDTSAVAMFKLADALSKLPGAEALDTYFLAWTTTPWTLPSNTALAVGAEIEYVVVKTYHPSTHQAVQVVLAKDLLSTHFPEKNADLEFAAYKPGDKAIPFQVVVSHLGKALAGLRYEQLLPFAQPEDGDAFRVITGDFVTTSDGTGIVHIAPSFGADDFRAAKQNGIGSLTLVDKRGRFLPQVQDGTFHYGEEYVKEAYLDEAEKAASLEKQRVALQGIIADTSKIQYLSVDERIVLKLQQEGKLFKKEKYEHSYPHCWRTDKPILYYPLDSWFVKVTAKKDRMIELNKTINWKPEHTGTGRFGEWLNNLQDWNLSRSRFWGIPLPIWRSEDGTEEKCIGSVEELKREIEKATQAGYSSEFPMDETLDLHKPYIDRVVLLSDSGKVMHRESDLIDVWFDSGAMPFAQMHYPFENKAEIDDRTNYPADFIAEGVDQTRGWFYTLHAISVLLFDSVAYKNVVSNGLVLDKNGNKMSKRLGNAVDPFETIAKYGADATRWYMITNASPWDNLKFDQEGIAEVQRKFFGTLYNTYSFFALYANIDGFAYAEEEIPLAQRPEIDRWVLSELNSLIALVDNAYSEYEPTKAGRAIEYFVAEHLSNWYVRLCRRRFWKGSYTSDKIAAYQTLYTCLETIAHLASPIAPFFSDRLFKDLNAVAGRNTSESVHLSRFPKVQEANIDKALEERMELAQKICSMVLSIRKKENIRVRQPLNTIQIPITGSGLKEKIEAVKELILSELNVKKIEFVDESQTRIVKNLKLNFKTLGKKCGKDMKEVQAYAAANSKEIIGQIEAEGKAMVHIAGNDYQLDPEDVDIIPVDIPGWKVANAGAITVALDTVITPELKEEGLARELVNRIQNLRKEKFLEVTDKITLHIEDHEQMRTAILNNLNYICTETLAVSLVSEGPIDPAGADLVDVDEEIRILIKINKA